MESLTIAFGTTSLETPNILPRVWKVTMQFPNWITIERCDHSVKHWEIIDGWYMPPEEVGGGPGNTYVIIYADGVPAYGYKAIQQNGGVTPLPPKTNEAGQAQADFNMTADSSFDPGQGQIGPYSISMDGFPSDKAKGMGLPLRRHVQYYFVFELREGSGPVPPPVEPPSGEYVTKAELESEMRKVFEKWIR